MTRERLVPMSPCMVKYCQTYFDKVHLFSNSEDFFFQVLMAVQSNYKMYTRIFANFFGRQKYLMVVVEKVRAFTILDTLLQ